MSRSLRILPVWALAFASFATLASTALATTGGVTIGEVSSRVTRGGVSYESMLRAASQAELATLYLSHVPTNKPVIVSVALVRLDTQRAHHAVDSSCKVSATLRDARGGSLLAVLDGQARATSGDPPGEVEASALRGALHSALADIPEALVH